MSGTPLAVADEALAEIDSCVAKLDAGLDVGYQRIVERCPALPAALKDSRFSAWLPHDWDRPGNQLSGRGLAVLEGLLARETHRASSGPELSVAAVPSILAALTLLEMRGLVAAAYGRYRPAGPLIDRIEARTVPANL